MPVAACAATKHGDSAPRRDFTSRPLHSDRSPLHDVRHHARSDNVGGARIVFLRTSLAGGRVWWSQTGSNRRPPACKAGALPTELWPRTSRYCWLVGSHGSPSRSSRAAIARLRPMDYGVAAFAALRERRLVGLGRFELPTSRLSSARSNQLSYKPEPGVSDQKPAIRSATSSSLITEYRIPITDSWPARSRRKRNGDGGVLQ